MSRAEPRSTLTALQDQIRAAAQARAPLAIRGGGTKDFYGERVVGTVLDVAAHAGIVDYEPTELVLTARAGTPLEEIESAMQASGQMLAFEPPRFGPESTLGGVIAAGLSGPRRPYGGAARDLMLGVRILDGTGEELTFGGQVMKNVAGFDVSRLMTGALGTLGVITEVSLKCMPLPKAEVTLVFAFRPDEALRKVNEWGAQALPLSATCYHDGRLSLRLSGAEPAVAAAMRKLGGTVDDGGPAFWASIRDQTHPVLAGSDALGGDLWRLSIGASAPYADWSGTQLIEWGGALRWLRAGPGDDAARIRAWAAAQGGHANLYRAADKSAGVFAPLSAPVRGLHERLKAVFDPHGILNPGRMYPDL
jgi:glycolate oxidase FAD binding subunit